MEILRLFITDCLFFRSQARTDKILGFFGWLSILLFIYSVVQIIRL